MKHKVPTEKPVPPARVVSREDGHHVVRPDGASLVRFDRYEDARRWAIGYAIGHSERAA